ncbi:unnamed protein product, partial [Dovyalis caffra]
MEEVVGLKPNEWKKLASLKSNGMEEAFNNHDAKMEEATTVKSNKMKEAFNIE